MIDRFSLQKGFWRCWHGALFGGCLLCLSMPVLAHTNYAEREDVQAFIDEMVKTHGFDREFLTRQFARAKRLDNVLESIAKPAERTLTWKQYRPIFLKKNRIEQGRKFLQKHRDVLERAEQKYGVPKEIITAIVGVETYYGKHTGRYTIFDSLTTLGFDYPPRSRFFKKELEAFLQLSREEHIDIEDMTGSYAGAMGMPQFISSSYRAYAVDFDGDGKRDLWHSIDDVIGSVANYFYQHGWQAGQGIVVRASIKDPSVLPEKNRLKPYLRLADFRKQGGAVVERLPEDTLITPLKLHGKYGVEYWAGLHNFYVITRYNHSVLYAMAVYQLSREFNRIAY